MPVKVKTSVAKVAKEVRLDISGVSLLVVVCLRMVSVKESRVQDLKTRLIEATFGTSR